MGRVQGKVAFVTGAARGQGRSHAIRLAQEGADIIAVDICRQIGSIEYPLSTPEDLAETAKEIEALDRRVVAREADVRDFRAIATALDEGVAELGRLDIVSANAGVASFGPAHELSEDKWQDMIDVDLTGVWHTTKAATPHLIAGGRGGSMILTSSAAGILGLPNLAHYVAAKHGVTGLMRALAQELAPYSIRVNSLHPSMVNTDMIHNSATYATFAPDLSEAERTRDAVSARYQGLNLLPVRYLEPVDISNAVLWLASDEARYVTGVALPLDAGMFDKSSAVG